MANLYDPRATVLLARMSGIPNSNRRSDIPGTAMAKALANRITDSRDFPVDEEWLRGREDVAKSLDIFGADPYGFPDENTIDPGALMRSKGYYIELPVPEELQEDV